MSGYKFQPQLDFVGLIVAFSSILILLYFGLTTGTFAPDYWVAFAFWFIGFFGMLFIVRRNKKFTFPNLFIVAAGVGMILVVFYLLSFATLLFPGELLPATKLVSFAIGVAEELFFGVFLLVTAINWLHLHPMLAIAGTSLAHAFYHIPAWGTDPMQLMYFFTAFFIARTVFVYVAPYVGVIVGAHGIWNFIVS